MSDLKEMFEALRAPFPASCVKTKTLKGTEICYLTARAVMDRLDTVCGPENWRDEYEIHGKAVACTLYLYIPRRGDGLLCGYGWIGKTDTGVESNWEPEKGAFSDALKRAAVRWGVGRYLYGDGEQDTQKPAGGGGGGAGGWSGKVTQPQSQQSDTGKCSECNAPEGKHATNCERKS